MNTASVIAIGTRFGAWVVLDGPFREKRITQKSINYFPAYECKCDCGTLRRIRACLLIKKSRSCGCLRSILIAQKNTRHGHNRGKKQRAHLYRLWSGMLQRCHNPRNSRYPAYGGRGIVVDPAWHTFSVFAAWAFASGYEETLQIDRCDNDGNYTPTNCRWVTNRENNRNKRNNHFITAFGVTQTVMAWALDPRCSGVSPPTIVRRINVQGFSPEDAITKPRANREKSPRFAERYKYA